MAESPWENPRPIAELPVLEIVSGIYFLMKGGVVVYVGKSTSVLARILTHVRQSLIDFDGYAYQRHIPANLNEMERHYIEMFLPECNSCVFSRGVRKKRLGKDGLAAWEARRADRWKAGKDEDCGPSEGIAQTPSGGE